MLSDITLPSVNVSRETLEQLHRYSDLLLKWQKSINLVSKNSDELWVRHIQDSLQLIPYINSETQKRIIDMGSGGGLPGMVLAIAFPQHSFHLIESDRKKAIFLQECARELGLSHVRVSNKRLEEINETADIITARALANITTLLGYAHRFFQNETYCLFLKGKNWDNELTCATTDWQFELESFSSLTSVEGRVIKISQLCRITV